MRPAEILSRAIHEYPFYGLILVSSLLVAFSFLSGMSLQAAVIFVLGFPITMFINKVLKNTFKTARPRNTPKTMDYAFPSNHAQTVSYLSIFLGLHAPLTLIASLPLFMLVVFHRLQGKHHRTLDIVGGTVIGGSIAVLLSLLIP